MKYKFILFSIFLLFSACSQTPIHTTLDINATVDTAIHKTSSLLLTKFYSPSETMDIPTITLTPTQTSTQTPTTTDLPLVTTEASWNDGNSGRILFRWRKEKTTFHSDELVMMDGDGNNIQKLGYYAGPPAWSPSGRWIAVGDQDPNSNPVKLLDNYRIATSIRIIDTSTIKDPKQIVTDMYSSVGPHSIKNIPLPEVCLEIEPIDWYLKGNFYTGIASISWSPDEEDLVVVCGTSGDRIFEQPAVLHTCIISLDGDADCWESEFSKGVARAVWSPTEDILAVSTVPGKEAKIYLVNPDGSNPEYLTDGSNVEWSPDGEELAFFRYFDYPKFGGLAIIDKSGNDFRWLHQDTDELYLDVPFCADDCPLSWSSDGRYLVFVASGGPGFFQSMLRIDIQTGDIHVLLDHYLFGDWAIMPDWGP